MKREETAYYRHKEHTASNATKNGRYPHHEGDHEKQHGHHGAVGAPRGRHAVRTGDHHVGAAQGVHDGFVADLATDTAETALAGGPSDRRFSRWYATDVKRWLAFERKTLVPRERGQA